MADVMPNPMVEQQRLRWNILQQQAAIQQKRLEVLEMADQKTRHLLNIEASERAIDEAKQSLANGTKVEQQRLKVTITNIRSTIEKQTLAVLEMQDRLVKTEEDMEKHRIAENRYRTNLAAMEKAHGLLTEDAYESMKATLLAE